VLRGLIDKGFVKLGRFRNAADKRRYAYVLTPGGLAEKSAITRRFLARKRAEYAALKREIDELGAELRGTDSGQGRGADRFARRD
jgi:DNA-binding MarR family transcriptional regulator